MYLLDSPFPESDKEMQVRSRKKTANLLKFYGLCAHVFILFHIFIAFIAL